MMTTSQSFPILSNCFIAGCARNCGRHIPSVFENIRKIATLFKQTKVLIAFDYSVDNTLELLNAEKANEANTNMDIEILVNTEPLSSIRTERIATARNRLIERMRQLYTPLWEYFIMIDLDDVCSSPINTENIAKYLYRTDWDALSWNRTTYYDIWALSYPPFVVSCWNWGGSSRQVVHFMTENIHHHLSQLGEDELFPVNSAFNGLALYRSIKFLDCEYNWRTMAFEALPQSEVVHSIRVFGIYPQYTNVYDDCEHREFHRQAIAKNNAKIRISPLKIFVSP
jgi:hypothetical protein